MTRTITYDLVYDATAVDVAAMLADPAFREEVCDFQRVLRKTVTVSTENGELDVTIDQVQAAQGIPGFAKKFVGDEINIVQTEHWATAEQGRIAVTIPGKPGEMKGTATLTEADGVTTESVRLDVKVSIPLVGGKIEGLIGDLLLKALKAENKVGRDYLSR